MTPELTRLLALLAAGIVLVVLAVYWWTQRTPSAEKDDAPLPLFGGIQPGERYTPPQGMAPLPPPSVPVPERASARPDARAPHRAPEPSPEPVRPVAASRVPPVPAPAPVADIPRPRPVIREFSTVPAAKPAPTPEAAPTREPAPPAPAPAQPPAADTPVISPAGVPGTMVEGHTLRFSVPAEGTLQFLPGRFEIQSGLDAGREIRFVHVPGPNGMEVTFGRSEGELYRHIQLRDKTVSRQHARLQLRDGAWHLVNLSQTNPVAWNGTVLGNEQEQRLADGDRIEMGEVVFTFRTR